MPSAYPIQKQTKLVHSVWNEVITVTEVYEIIRYTLCDQQHTYLTLPRTLFNNAYAYAKRVITSTQQIAMQHFLMPGAGQPVKLINSSSHRPLSAFETQEIIASSNAEWLFRSAKGALFVRNKLGFERDCLVHFLRLSAVCWPSAPSASDNHAPAYNSAKYSPIKKIHLDSAINLSYIGFPTTPPHLKCVAKLPFNL